VVVVVVMGLLCRRTIAARSAGRAIAQRTVHQTIRDWSQRLSRGRYRTTDQQT
jgi:hypothetical protein